MLVAIYYKGLKDSIKDKLSWEKALKDIDKIVKKAIHINNYLEERRMEKKGYNFIWVPTCYTLE